MRFSLEEEQIKFWNSIQRSISSIPYRLNNVVISVIYIAAVWSMKSNQFLYTCSDPYCTFNFLDMGLTLYSLTIAILWNNFENNFKYFAWKSTITIDKTLFFDSDNSDTLHCIMLSDSEKELNSNVTSDCESVHNLRTDSQNFVTIWWNTSWNISEKISNFLQGILETTIVVSIFHFLKMKDLIYIQ